MAHLRRRSSFINKAQDIVLFQDNFDGVVLNPNSDYTIVDPDSVFSQNDELIRTYNNLGSNISLKSVVSYNLNETGTLTFAWKIKADQDNTIINSVFFGLMSLNLNLRRVSIFYRHSIGDLGWQTKITSPQNELIILDFETSPKRMRVTLQSNLQKLEYWDGAAWTQLGTARTQVEGGDEWFIGLTSLNNITFTDILDDFIITNQIYSSELP